LSSSKATISIEDSERVLPMRGVDTITEKVTETEDFEAPEECVALESDEVQDVADQPSISKEAKIIEVTLFSFISNYQNLVT